MSCCAVQVLEPRLGEGVAVERNDSWQIHPAVFCPSGGLGGGDEGEGDAFY